MFRRLLILALLPVVLLGFLLEPAAAVDYGDVEEWTFNAPMAENNYPDGDLEIDCNAAGVWTVYGGSTVMIEGNIDCDFAAYLYSDPGPEDTKDNDWTLTFNGTRPTTEECSATGSSTGDLQNGWEFAAGEFEPDCNVTEVCLTGSMVWEFTGRPDSDMSVTVCTNVAFGPPPDGTGSASCQYGNPIEAYTSVLDTNDDGTYKFDSWVRFSDLVSQSGWSIMAIYKRPVGGQYGLPSSPTTSWPEADRIQQTKVENFFVSSSEPPEIGFGVQVWNTQITPSNGGFVSTGGPTSGSHWGFTVPTKCYFYMGPKYRATADETDEPYGPVGGPLGPEPPDTTVDPPDDSEEGCDFDVTAPSTWLSGGMCSAVGLLGEIWNFFEGFFGGLLALLQQVFLPSPGFFSGQFEQLQDSWQDTPPATVLEGLTDVAGAATSVSVISSCQGPLFEFTEPVGHQQVSVYPFSACSGGMATLASIVHTALTVMVYIGAYSAGLRIIGHAFGLDYRFAQQKV